MTPYFGSEWHQWDLHIHTPISIVEHYAGSNLDDKWERFITDLERMPSSIKAIGINDYLFLDGYEKVLEYKSKGRLANIELILPVIELRLSKFCGTHFNKINLHIIFSNELKTKTIKSQFINQLSAKYRLTPSCIDSGISWEGYIARESLIDLGKSIKASVPANELPRFGSDLQEGFNNLVLDEEPILKLLNGQYLKGKCLTAIGKTEWSELKWGDSSIAAKKDIINKVHLVFTSSPSVEIFARAKNSLTENNVNDLLLDCSDAHYNVESKEKDRIGKCFTWIKSDLRFEGLKQIIHEPSRLYVGKDKPTCSPHRIDKLNFSFPCDSMIESEHFCFQGENEIVFSPYYTCLVGGRGTGKSTLLNLMDAAFRPTDNHFFNNNRLACSTGQLDIPQCVKINDDTATFFEFLSQNQVEELALDVNKFTNAIYMRLLKKDNEGKIVKQESCIANDMVMIDKYIESLTKRESIKNRIAICGTEINRNKKILDSFKNENYKLLRSKIQGHENSLSLIDDRKKKYTSFINEILLTLARYTSYIDDEATNNYSRALKEAYVSITKILDNTNKNLFEEDKSYEAIIRAELAEFKIQLVEYLGERGLTQENQKDISEAAYVISKNELEMQNLTKELYDIEQYLSNTNPFEICEHSVDFIKLIGAHLDQINQELSLIQNTSVSKINLEYTFDYQSAHELIVEEFLLRFNQYINNIRVHRPQLIDLLLSISPLEIMQASREDFIARISKAETKSKLKEILVFLFKSEENYLIYMLIVAKHLYNHISHKSITVYYDGKTLDKASFGQRCTAAIVILLLLGNHPIVIDEPEAHLDSVLIAGYLVDVLKTAKRNRQIIFATHNANFVINGDADLIHILEIDHSGKTSISSTSIEGLTDRNHLYRLEGGHEAFKQRELKYRSVIG